MKEPWQPMFQIVNNCLSEHKLHSVQQLSQPNINEQTDNGQCVEMTDKSIWYGNKTDQMNPNRQSIHDINDPFSTVDKQTKWATNKYMKNCQTLPLSTVMKLTIWKCLSNLIQMKVVKES